MATKVQINKLKKVVRSANRRTNAANEAFNKLPPSVKRVQIARDVLAQLDSKRLIAASGFWLTGANSGKLFDKADIIVDAELQDVLSQTKKCEGCALGGMFMCAVERANKLKVGSLDNEEGNGQLSETDTFDYLKKFFSLEQLNLIEFTFEKGRGAAHGVPSDQQELALTFFGDDVYDTDYVDDGNDDEVGPTPEIRMRLIMENIIANKGRFVVTRKPVLTWTTPGFAS